jgi:hypothetical protein
MFICMTILKILKKSLMEKNSKGDDSHGTLPSINPHLIIQFIKKLKIKRNYENIKYLFIYFFFIAVYICKKNLFTYTHCYKVSFKISRRINKFSEFIYRK